MGDFHELQRRVLLFVQPYQRPAKGTGGVPNRSGGNLYGQGTGRAAGGGGDQLI